MISPCYSGLHIYNYIKATVMISVKVITNLICISLYALYICYTLIYMSYMTITWTYTSLNVIYMICVYNVIYVLQFSNTSWIICWIILWSYYNNNNKKILYFFIHRHNFFFFFCSKKTKFLAFFTGNFGSIKLYYLLKYCGFYINDILEVCIKETFLNVHL